MGFFKLLLFMLWGTVLVAQTPKVGTFFPEDGSKSSEDSEVCTENIPRTARYNKQFIPDEDVEKLVKTIMDKAYGLPNRFIIQSCTGTKNCEAVVNKKGTPYILYNPEFLGKVKRLQFTATDLTETFQQDWETLTILAHEVGHHLLNHITAPQPGATQADCELEADRTAGYIMCKLGATLEQAQSVMRRPEVPEYATMGYPSRNERLEAIKQGFVQAKNQDAPNPEVPCLQNALPGYLGLTGFSSLGGGLFLLGVSKWNNAIRWFQNSYKSDPIGFATGDFEKFYSDYSTNSKFLMGLGTAVMVGGSMIFLSKIAKVGANNRNCPQRRFSSLPQKHILKIEPLLGNTQEGLPGIGIVVRFNKG
jgi:hypothetical protein